MQHAGTIVFRTMDAGHMRHLTSIIPRMTSESSVMVGQAVSENSERARQGVSENSWRVGHNQPSATQKDHQRNGILAIFVRNARNPDTMNS